MSTFERRIEQRAQNLCSDKILNHAVLQRLVLFWVCKVGKDLGLCDATFNLLAVWASRKEFDLFLKHESRDNAANDRGIFPIIFNTRALHHICLQPHCRWALTQDGNFTCTSLADGTNVRKPKVNLGTADATMPGAAKAEAEADPNPSLTGIEAPTGYELPSAKRTKTCEDEDLLVKDSNGATGQYHALIRLQVEIPVVLAASLNNIQDPQSLATSLGLGGSAANVSITGVILRRATKTSFNVYFPHQADHSRFSDATQLRFTASFLRQFILALPKVDWADPLLRDCIGGVEFAVEEVDDRPSEHFVPTEALADASFQLTSELGFALFEANFKTATCSRRVPRRKTSIL